MRPNPYCIFTEKSIVPQTSKDHIRLPVHVTLRESRAAISEYWSYRVPHILITRSVVRSLYRTLGVQRVKAWLPLVSGCYTSLKTKIS